MWSSRLFWKVFLVYAGLNLALAAGFLLVVSRWQRSLVLDQTRQRLHDSAIILRSHVVHAGDSELQRLVVDLAGQTHMRMTLIDARGVVLADSEEDPHRMENHAGRPELVGAASAAGVGLDTRRSATLGYKMLYLALPADSANTNVAFVRVATGLDQIERHVAAIQRFLWNIAFAIGLLALVSTYAVVRRIIRPLGDLTRSADAMASGEDGHLVALRRKDELGRLATAFNQMQQKRSQQLAVLRENSDCLAAVLGNMAEGVIAVGADESILLANESSRRLLEIRAPDAVGRPLLEVSRNRAVHEAVAETLRTKRPCQKEFETAAGARRMLAMRTTPLAGIPETGVLVVLHDVTGLRRLENLRREFVANVSHELKTPLASIKAYAETLRLGAIHDPQNNLEFVRRIEEQAERLHQLIMDLLQLARVEAGQEMFEITDVSIPEVVRHCLDYYQSAAKAKSLTLEDDPSGGPICVRVDEEGLRTILNNLVDNAIKYTPAEGRVTVAWRKESQMAVLEVRDTGIGIAPGDQLRVFERFYRSDKARSRELGGTGLGLSIVKHLAQAFGGSVGLTSELGKGSTFLVYLPPA